MVILISISAVHWITFSLLYWIGKVLFLQSYLLTVALYIGPNFQRRIFQLNTAQLLTLIGKFPGHEPNRYLENSSMQILWGAIHFCSKSGCELDRFLEIASKKEGLSNKKYSMSFPVIGLGHDTMFWMSFPIFANNGSDELDNLNLKSCLLSWWLRFLFSN